MAYLLWLLILLCLLQTQYCLLSCLYMGPYASCLHVYGAGGVLLEGLAGSDPPLSLLPLCQPAAPTMPLPCEMRASSRSSSCLASNVCGH